MSLLHHNCMSHLLVYMNCKIKCYHIFVTYLQYIKKKNIAPFKLNYIDTNLTF